MRVDDPAPGLALLVTDRHGESASATQGLASVEHGVPMELTTVTHVASIAKQLTGILVRAAEREGRLSGSDPLDRWLPGVDPTREVMLDHCVHHTSGLPDAETLLSVMGLREFDYYSREDLLGILSHHPRLMFRPGERFSYTNTGYWALGMVLESVYDEPLEAVVERLLLEPSGMTGSRIWSRPDLVVRGRASSYRSTPAGLRRADRQTSMVGSSALLSSAADLDIWLCRRSDTLAGLGLVPHDVEAYPCAVQGFTADFGYGSGCFVERMFDAPVRWTHHAGHEHGYSATAMSSSEGDRVVAISNTAELDASVAGLVAARGLVKGRPSAEAVQEAIEFVGRRQPESQPPSGSPEHLGPSVAALDHLAGTYVSRSLPLPIGLEVDGEHLVVRRGGAVDALQATPTGFRGPGYTLEVREGTSGCTEIAMDLPRAGVLVFSRAERPA